jgi:hypothetical protein
MAASGDCAEDSQLLSQREVLEHQRVMSARENDQQSNEMDEPRDYGLAYVVRLICLRPR